MANSFRILVALLCALAVSPAHAATAWDKGLEQIERQLTAGLDAYRHGQPETADQRFADAYFVAYEASGLEIAVRQFISAKHNYEIEKAFQSLRFLVADRAPFGDVDARVRELRLVLAKDVTFLNAQATGGSTADAGTAPEQAEATAAPGLRGGHAFVQALLIIVREGFEAILLIGALVAYVGRAGRHDQIRVIYRAAAAALAASLLTAYAFNKLLAVSPARQEALEGATMLVAAGVLFYVSYWLISKSESRRWQQYIREKVDTADRVWALGAVAFLAVYREGAETVLFYQALFAGMSGAQHEIVAGFLVGSLLLLVLFVLFRRAVAKLPAGPFFGVTSAFLYYVAFVFAGQGIHELQEGAVVSTTPLALVPHIEWLGIFPSAEGIAVQSLFIVALIVMVARWFGTTRTAGAHGNTSSERAHLGQKS